MAKIFINGLYFDNNSNKGVTVNIFENQSTDNSFGNLIFTSNSDSFGKATGDIDNKFIGKEIVFTIIEPGFIPLQTKLKVTELGLFYSVKLDIDRSYIGHDSRITDQSQWNSQSNYIKAQTELQGTIRRFKFQNIGVNYAHYFIAMLSIILGLFTPFPYNLVFGILFFIISEILGPYVMGLKPFWKRK